MALANYIYATNLLVKTVTNGFSLQNCLLAARKLTNEGSDLVLRFKLTCTRYERDGNAWRWRLEGKAGNDG